MDNVLSAELVPVKSPLDALMQAAAGRQQNHLDQYFGVWAILENVFSAGVERAEKLDLHLHLQSEDVQAAAGKGKAKQHDLQVTDNGVAIINIHGTLMKHASSFSSNTSTVLARRQVRAAAADDSISGILLHIDSPGGTVAGTQELADDIAAADKIKPVHAYIEDLGASAAFWLASQARHISANATAIVGSIGTYGVIQDLSGAAAQQGVKVHVVRAGEFKGTGQPGTEVNAEQLAELQRVVNGLNEHFLEGVARGRKMPIEAVRGLADGRVHLGAQAKKIGLIDAVESLDQVLTNFHPTPQKGSRAMTTQPNAEAAPVASENTGSEIVKAQLAPTAATIQQIQAACPGIDNDFAVGLLSQSLTTEQATGQWMAEMHKRLEARAASITELQGKAAAGAIGVSANINSGGGGTSNDGGGDAISQFETAVAALVATGKTRAKATSAVVKSDPELHAAYIDAYNQLHAPSRRRRK